MEGERPKVPFKLQRISTEQFATIKSTYKEGEKVNFSISLDFRASAQNKRIAAMAKFEFDQKKKVFLLIEVACHFAIEKAAWDAMISENQDELILPQGFATHLAVLTVGTARGILHAKTEHTAFNEFLVPAIDLTEIIDKDPVLKLKND